MFAPLANLLREPAPAPPSGLAAHRRLLVIAITAAAALMFNHYLAINGSLSTGAQAIAAVTGNSPQQLLLPLQRSPWFGLYQQLWWGASLLLAYVVIPMLVLKFVLRDAVMDSGLRWGDTGKHKRYYFLFGGVMAVMALAASFSSTFLHTYPFYRLASRSVLDLFLWECLYVLQFFCVEYFYRGFLLRSLQPSFGVNSIYISSLLYLTIHLPKPFMECVGSLLFGLILCLLAMLCRSIWGGVFVHVCLAVSMDVLSLIQTDRWPALLTP